jgi:3-deoxy-D-manno-octulosonic-acid transferase
LNLSWYGYNLLVTTVGASAAWLWRHSGRTTQDPTFWEGRFGYYRDDLTAATKGTPRFWFHAASVGEVTGAMATIHLLRERSPGAAIWLTVGTPTGFRFAGEKLGDVTQIQPFPLDFPWVIQRAFHSIRPDVYIALEGEFWPNLYWQLHSRHVPALLLNGRISEGSAKNYRRAKGLFQPIFRRFRWLAMHSEADRQRATALGAPTERTLVLGSAKYDSLLARTANRLASSWHDAFGILGDTPVVVGGSLRRSECTELLRVFKELRQARPRLVGIFAPRHLDQLPRMTDWLQSAKLPFQLSSRLRLGLEKRLSPVVLVDEMGVLFDLYALGDLVFCGGTLEPLGGHNILEPAAWGKVVFYGPHVDRVRAEHQSLQSCGAGILVKDGDDLLVQWRMWLDRLAELQSRGDLARSAVRRLGGVAAKQVDMILASLPATRTKIRGFP